ncbi:leucine-rich repeat-containing protein 20 isoform X6 [Gopherus flavomarginatus]|uniref:leucine-rich repeat-containing protein 20 isoform X6 n=1 Tax=Gopherus flavomarginatus TaxID=286002 RepID=UPI0021CC3580|nr:leucine-rich repeat-containing protein 20 isoform X6 [Gopherus flavomarginatus]
MLATHVCVQYTMCTLGAPIGVQFPLWTCFPGGIGRGAYMEKIMGEAVARVARKVNETVENGADSLELNLEGNYLHRLPEEMRTLLHLKVINLSRNKFRHFPEQLTTLKALETINLEENEITDVPVEKLSSMESLQSVNLKSNPLNEEVQVIARPLIKFDLLVSPKGTHAAPQA